MYGQPRDSVDGEERTDLVVAVLDEEEQKTSMRKRVSACTPLHV
jgi:hypothetical protein